MKKTLFILTVIILTSCSVSAPNYVYKMDTYKVTKTNKFSVTAVSKGNKEIKVRNFDLKVGDTLYNWTVIPVIKF